MFRRILKCLSCLKSSVLLYFVGLASLTFGLLYIVRPQHSFGPEIEVEHVILNAGGNVKTKLKLIEVEQEKAVVFDPDELEMEVSEGEVEEFYSRNVMLKCTASFPVSWFYIGHGIPKINVATTRASDQIYEETSYTFSATLSFAPLRESASGHYKCKGISEELSDRVSSLYVFIPGTKLFLIDTTVNLESDLLEELFIPCPVSDPFKNITLKHKGNPIDSSFIKSFKPWSGFTLNAKYLETEDNPLGYYQCEHDKSSTKSGSIVVAIRKDLIVKSIPDNEKVVYDDNFDGEFSCKAKQNITLKYRRIKIFRKVAFKLDLSSEYPFEAFVRFNKQDLREGSRIFCITTIKKTPLHSWNISFVNPDTSYENVGVDLQYDEDSDEFKCCNKGAKKAPDFGKLACGHPLECNMKLKCLNAKSKICEVKDKPRMRRSGSCISYKVQYNLGNISSGLLRCSLAGKNGALYYINSKEASSGNVSAAYFLSAWIFPKENISSAFLEVHVKYDENTETLKLTCSCPKFLFSKGIYWQLKGESSAIYPGKDIVKEDHIISNLLVGLSKQRLSKINGVVCIAPVWNSEKDYIYSDLITVEK